MRTRLLLLLLAVVAAPAGAQDTSRVAPGDMVRVTARGWKLRTGTFMGFRGDSVVVWTTDLGLAEDVIPFAAVKRFEVNHGNRPAESMFLEGLLGGVVIGLSYGFTNAALYQCDSAAWVCDPVNTITFFTAFGAALGGITGALTRAPPYRTVRLQPHAGLTGLPGGRVGLGVALTLGP